MSSKIFLYLSFVIAFLFVSCSGPDPLFDLSEERHMLLNTDSTSVEFPADYKGNYSLITFIFTNCPDVCPVITANMKNIQDELSGIQDVQFIEISFDPERDTPSVLKDYKELYRLNNQFSLLTGDTTSIRTLLNRLEIVAEKTQVETQKEDSSQYMMKHSNIIYLMDPEGRILQEYPASITPPEHIAEDLTNLQ